MIFTISTVSMAGGRILATSILLLKASTQKWYTIKLFTFIEHMKSPLITPNFKVGGRYNKYYLMFKRTDRIFVNCLNDYFHLGFYDNVLYHSDFFTICFLQSSLFYLWCVHIIQIWVLASSSSVVSLSTFSCLEVISRFMIQLLTSLLSLVSYC